MKTINVKNILKGDLYWTKIKLEDILDSYKTSLDDEKCKKVYDYILKVINQIDSRMLELGI